MIATITDCPRCDGGCVEANDLDCNTCHGYGTVTLADSADYLAAQCAHGNHPTDGDCGLCLFTLHDRPATNDEAHVLWPTGWQNITAPF